MPGLNPYPLDFIIDKLKTPVAAGTFVIFNSRSCNRDCDFCYIKNMNWGKQPFDYAEIDAVFQANENIVVGFAGGEPFMDRDAMAAFGYALSRYRNKIKSVQIMSNMDFYKKVRGWLDMLPVKLSITTNARNRYFFQSDDHVKIWNGVFLDEFIGIENYPVGEHFSYAFSMKNPAYFNNMTDEGTRFDADEVFEKMQHLYDAGCEVTVLSTSDFVEYATIRNMFLDQRYLFTKKINFPANWKEEYVDLNSVCGKCGKENAACKTAIETNTCPRLQKECFHCDKINVCSTFRLPEKIFMKERYPDCSLLKRVMDMGQHFRALTYRDKNQASFSRAKGQFQPEKTA